MEMKFNTRQVADRLQVTPQSVTRWIREGKFLNAVKVNPTAGNSPYIIPLSDIEQFERRRDGLAV